MKQEKATVLEHRVFQGDYRILRLAAPEIGPLVEPGQFLELQVPHLGERILRRPFSIYKADADGVEILYKPVGRGTHAMCAISGGNEVDLLGPLGTGFPVPEEEKIPVLIAGGYGNAALYLQAKQAQKKGVAFFGGRTAVDILCVKEFEALGWEVRVTTNDGSLGVQGLVTDAFNPWLAQQSDPAKVEVFSCGPSPMLRAVGNLAEQKGFTAWLSMDERMACGVGACLACVIKRRTPDGSWEWVRCCKEGPVFEAREILWDE